MPDVLVVLEMTGTTKKILLRFDICVKYIFRALRATCIPWIKLPVDHLLGSFFRKSVTDCASDA